MSHQGTTRPTNNSRSNHQGVGVTRQRRNPGNGRHSEKIDSQNNIISRNSKTDERRPILEWDHKLPVPLLSQKTAASMAAILSLLCYLNSCYGNFVFDDTEAVLSNKDVKPSTPIMEIFYDDFWGEKMTKNHSHKSYRPITVLSFRLNYLLCGGFHPFGFHLTNILLHTIISVLSLRVFSILFSDNPHLHEAGNWGVLPAPRASFVCTLLFTSHPIHTESVAGIVGRADLLCALFFFLSFYFYVLALQKDGHHSYRRLFYCVLCCTASMLCKEQGITVIGVCVIYDIVVNCKVDMFQVFHHYRIHFSNEIKSMNPRWLTSLATRLCIMILCAVFLLAGRLLIMGSGPPPFQPSDNPASFADGILTRVTNYNLIYALNFWILTFPKWLCFDWSMGCVSLIQSTNDFRLLAPIALWVLLVRLTYKCVKYPPSHRRRVLTMSLVLLIVPFLPASNIFLRVGFVIAERVLYLPSIGFCMMLTLLAERLTYSPTSRKVVQYILVVLLVCYVSRCIWRNREWSSEERLYKAGLKVCPRNAKVHYNIGKNAADRGNISAAVTYYRQAISLNPVYDQAMNNLGNLLKDQGHLSEAEELLYKAVTIRPQFAAAWMNLGIIQAATKKYTEAEESYKTALIHRHRYADCYFNLGIMYLDLGRDKEALSAWLNATSYQSDHAQAWSNAVVHLESLGQHKTAILIAKEALKHVPEEPSIYFGLGNVYGKDGSYEDAEENFLKAIRLNPKMANYHGNLGVLYHRWKKYEKAQQHYRAALALEPHSKNAKENLKKLQQTLARGKTKKHGGP